MKNNVPYFNTNIFFPILLSNLKEHLYIFSYRHIKTIQIFILVISSVQEGFEIRQLKLEDVGTIHELYPANDMEAVSVFEKLIIRLPAFGKSSSATVK